MVFLECPLPLPLGLSWPTSLLIQLRACVLRPYKPSQIFNKTFCWWGRGSQSIDLCFLLILNLTDTKWSENDKNKINVQYKVLETLPVGRLHYNFSKQLVLLYMFFIIISTSRFSIFGFTEKNHFLPLRAMWKPIGKIWRINIDESDWRINRTVRFWITLYKSNKLFILLCKYVIINVFSL